MNTYKLGGIGLFVSFDGGVKIYPNDILQGEGKVYQKKVGINEVEQIDFKGTLISDKDKSKKQIDISFPTSSSGGRKTLIPVEYNESSGVAITKSDKFLGLPTPLSYGVYGVALLVILAVVYFKFIR